MQNKKKQKRKGRRIFTCPYVPTSTSCSPSKSRSAAMPHVGASYLSLSGKDRASDKPLLRTSLSTEQPLDKLSINFISGSYQWYDNTRDMTIINIIS